MNYSIGDNIRSHRIAQGLTQTELGKRCGMADSQIGAYERNEVRPGKRNLERLANGLDVNVKKLLLCVEEKGVDA